METSAIYGLGKLLGHNCLAVNAIVANRVKKEFSKDGKAAVEKLIVKFMEIFAENSSRLVGIGEWLVGKARVLMDNIIANELNLKICLIYRIKILMFIKYH